MAVLCRNASLEMFRPLSYRSMHFLQGDLCRCFMRDLFRLPRLLWRFWQAISSETAHSLLSRGLRSGLREGQSLALIKAGMCLRSHSWVVFALWAGAESCWKTHFWPLKRVVLRVFTTCCSTSSWYTLALVLTPFSQKWRGVTPWWDTSHQTMM